MSDNNQILRLLATIREEVADIRSRQEELYELLLGYKDQIQDVKQTVVEGLEGLPDSPYIAGQLVPAPDSLEGVDEFGQLLATYLHKAPRGQGRTPPRDVSFESPEEVDEDDVVLEKDETLESGRKGRGRRSGGGGGGGSGGGLERGPDRSVTEIDLDDDGDGVKKKRRRRRRKKKTSSSAED
ncbi:MAG: hypothetical protein JKY65_20730 [Planctomycetes bacterium]|nr:hypothetical protein [Planctomycetota bacterium]